MTRRMYRSGMRWAFWRWTDVLVDGRPYLTRLHLIKLPSGRALMLHWIRSPDLQPDMHDHPVSFLSIVLRGGYSEITPTHANLIEWWNFKRATDAHRIVAVHPGTITLVFAGPKTREWGFHAPSGWVSWKEYPG